MTRFLKIAAVPVGLLIAVAAGALAQPPGGGQQNPFREKYKYTFQLMQMVGHIQEIDKDKKYTLSADQAKKVLAVLNPLRSKPKLTQEQAKQALKDLKKIFNAGQLNAMARIKPKFSSHGPGQGNGQRPPGDGQQPSGNDPGGPGSGGARRHFDPNTMKDFNPFYAPKAKTDDKSAQDRSKRWNDFFSAMEKKAKTAKAARPK